MAISARCRDQLNRAAGRILTQKQLDDIESRMRGAATTLARQDIGAWRAKSADQRMFDAAAFAQQEIKGEAQRKVVNAALQIAKTQALEDRLAVAKKLHPNEKRTDALVRDLTQTENQVEAIKREMTAGLLDAIDASTAKQGAGIARRAGMFLFDLDNPAMTLDLAREIFANANGHTGNKLAQQGAKAWLDTIETSRRRFNEAGGDVGALDYGYLPQAHDQAKVLQAGRDRWAADVLPKLDRSRYLNEDGSQMTDAQALGMLGRVWDTVSSGGANKRKPGEFAGTGARANRGSEHREIHFRDGDAYLQYLSQFGGGSMYDAMMGHIAQKARDVALVERYGPNPGNQMKLQADIAARMDGGDQRVFGHRLETYWNIVSGEASSIGGSDMLARIGQDVRNIQTAAKLAGALLSSVTDLGTYFITAGFNRLGYWKSLENIGTANRSAARDFLNAQGFMAESMMSSLNRWTGENVRDGITGRLANSTMKLSLLNAWTDGLRRAFQMTMMDGLAQLHGNDWGNLEAYDRWRLENAGITEQDWRTVRSANLDQYNGTPMLTPEVIRASGRADAEQVASKVMGLILDESQTAVINPDLAARAWATGGNQRGTVRGELWRSVMQFKSFPLAMMSRHWRRMLEMPQGLDGAPAISNRLAYAAALGLSLTALGAIAFQSKQLVSGKDPIDMTSPKFWLRAMAQGGAAGFLGDIVLSDSTDSRSPSDPLFQLAGPTAGSVAQLYALTKGNIDQALAGKPTHAGAEAVQFIRSHLPYVSLWYAKTALNREFLDGIQENLSPGYLARMKQKAQKDWHQAFWWSPNEAAPQRAPELSKVTGQ